MDSYNGGDATLADLVQKLGSLPDGPRVETGGGGYHLYFAEHQTDGRTKSGKLALGIDLKADGGYVIGPGSVHQTGRGYHAADEARFNEAPPFLPRAWRDYLARRSVKAETPERGSHERVGLAREFLKCLPPAVSGSGGHDAAWRAALTVVRGFDLDGQSALALLRDEYNPRCEPPWSEKDLRHKVESAARDGRLAPGYLLNGNVAANDEWGTPLSLDAPDLPTFPVDVLPDWLKRFVVDTAESTQTPVDMSAMLGFALLSTAVGNRVKVRAKSDHVEQLSVYTAVVLDPANRKSSVFGRFVAPLNALQVEADRRYESAHAQTEAQRVALEARLKQRSGASSHGAANESERAAISDELRALKTTARRRLYVDDCTSEKLVLVLKDNDGAAAVLSAEGGGPFAMMAGRYKDQPDFDIHLKGHSGDPVKVHRIGREDVSVMAPALTIGVTLQPEVLRAIGSEPSMRGRGLLGRFCFIIPRSPVGERAYRSAPVADSVAREYERRIKNLASIEPQSNVDGIVVAHELTLSVEADEAIGEFFDEVERQLSNQLAPIQDWAGKLVGSALRFAALLHLARHASDGSAWDQVAISAEDARGGIRVARYLLPHTIAAFDEMNAHEGVEAARAVLGWIERQGGTTFSEAQAWDGVRRRAVFKGAQALFHEALGELVARDFIRPRAHDTQGKAGRPLSTQYDVSPKWSAQGSPKKPENGASQWAQLSKPDIPAGFQHETCEFFHTEKEGDDDA